TRAAPASWRSARSPTFGGPGAFALWRDGGGGVLLARPLKQRRHGEPPPGLRRGRRRGHVELFGPSTGVVEKARRQPPERGRATAKSLLPLFGEAVERGPRGRARAAAAFRWRSRSKFRRSLLAARASPARGRHRKPFARSLRRSAGRA